MANTYRRDDQPGLEVVPPESDLQVSYPPQESLYVVHEGGHKEAIQASVDTGQSNSPPRKRTNKNILLIALVCLVIIIGVVVGAVVGTQKSRSSPTTTPDSTVPSQQPDSGGGGSTSMSSPAEMTGSPTSVSPGLAPTAISWGYPHMEIYALTRNDSDSLYTKYRNVDAMDNNWVPESYDMDLIGGSINADSSPSIAVNHRISSFTAGNQTEIFIDGNGAGYRKWHEVGTGWNPAEPDSWDTFFEDLRVTGAFALAKYEPSLEILKVFCLSDGDKGLAVYFAQWYGENWSRSIQIPGPDLQPMVPAVVAWNGNDSRIDVFVVGRANSHLLHTWWDAEKAEWSEYEDLHGFVTSPPVVVSRSPGILDVFVRGGDAGIWHLSYDNTNQSWTGWTSISGNEKVQNQPEAIAATSDTVDVFARRQDGALIYKSFNGASNVWTPEEGFEVLVDTSEGPFTGPPKAVSDGPGSIHVFAYRNQNELMWISLDSGSQGRTPEITKLANVPYM